MRLVTTTFNLRNVSQAIALFSKQLKLKPHFYPLIQMSASSSNLSVQSCIDCLHPEGLLDDELGLGLVHLPHARGRLAQLRPAAVDQGSTHEIPAEPHTMLICGCVGWMNKQKTFRK